LAVIWHCLRDPIFSRFGTIPVCDGQTDRHTTTAYTALALRRAVKIKYAELKRRAKDRKG